MPGAVTVATLLSRYSKLCQSQLQHLLPDVVGKALAAVKRRIIDQIDFPSDLVGHFTLKIKQLEQTNAIAKAPDVPAIQLLPGFTELFDTDDV